MPLGAERGEEQRGGGADSWMLVDFGRPAPPPHRRCFETEGLFPQESTSNNSRIDNGISHTLMLLYTGLLWHQSYLTNANIFLVSITITITTTTPTTPPTTTTATTITTSITITTTTTTTTTTTNNNNNYYYYYYYYYYYF